MAGTTRGIKLQEDNIERLTALLERQERAREKAEKASDNGADLKRLMADKTRLEEDKIALKSKIKEALVARKTPAKKKKKSPKLSLRDRLARRDPSPSPAPPPSKRENTINVRNLDMAFLTKKKGQAGSWGDRRESLDMSVKVINRDSVNDFNGMRVEVYAFGDVLSARGAYVLLKKHSATVDVPKRTTKEISLGHVAMQYYKDGAFTFGYKYQGYLIFVFDEDGEELKVKSNKPSFKKLREKLKALGEWYRFDKDGNSLGKYTYSW